VDADRDQSGPYHGGPERSQAPELQPDSAKLEQLVDDLVQRTIRPMSRPSRMPGSSRRISMR